MTQTATIALPEPQAKDLADAIAAEPALEALAVDTTETAPGVWRVIVYLSEEAREAEQTTLTHLAEARLGPGAPAFEIADLPDTDWIAKSLEGLTPVTAGRFVVHGGHDRGRIPRGRIAIEIDAGQAFGTGHHATTAGCLIVLDRLTRTRRFSRVLDLGTGSGVLAIAMAKVLRMPILASDIDAVSVGVARENARLNGVGGLVDFVVAEGMEHAAIRAAAPYDLVVANILAEPLCRLAASIAPRITRGGTLVLSGLLPHQRERVVAAYNLHGLRLVDARLIGGWSVLTLRRGRG